MSNTLEKLLSAAQKSGRIADKEMSRIYNSLWVMAILVFCFCLIAFFLNAFWDLKAPSLILALVITAIAIYSWGHPRHMLIVIGIGAGWGLLRKILGDTTLEKEIANVLRTHFAILSKSLLVITAFLLVTGSISFKGHAEILLPVLVALTVIGLFMWVFPGRFDGRFGLRIMYAFAFFIVSASLRSLIPGSVWDKYLGWTPDSLLPTKTETVLYQIEHAQKESADAAMANQLSSILQKVKDGEELSKEDRKILAEVQPSTESPVKNARNLPSFSLLIPANGTSERVRTKSGHRIEWEGNDISIHCVYRDVNRPEGILTDTQNTCTDGPMEYQYVVDTGGYAHTVSYKFIRAN